MQYLLMAYVDETGWPKMSKSEQEQGIAAYAAYGEALKTMPNHTGDGRLAEYQPYWAAWAQLLAKAGSHEEARQAYEVAIGLERDPAVRRFLERRRSGVLLQRTR
jgi:predicted RNA polymerase sigma factor